MFHSSSFWEVIPSLSPRRAGHAFLPVCKILSPAIFSSSFRHQLKYQFLREPSLTWKLIQYFLAMPLVMPGTSSLVTVSTPVASSASWILPSLHWWWPPLPQNRTACKADCPLSNTYVAHRRRSVVVHWGNEFKITPGHRVYRKMEIWGRTEGIGPPPPHEFPEFRAKSSLPQAQLPHPPKCVCNNYEGLTCLV